MMRMRRHEKFINRLLRRKRKIALHAGIGGFGLSDKACECLIEMGIPQSEFGLLDQETIERLWKGEPMTYAGRISPNQKYYGYLHNIERDDPRLIRVIEELGFLANGEATTLGITEIPAWIEWSIDEAETGYEWVQEEHRTWAATKTYLSTFDLINNLLAFVEMYDTWMASEKISEKRKRETIDEYNLIIKEIQKRGLDPMKELKKHLEYLQTKKERREMMIDNALRQFPHPKEPTVLDVDLEDE